MTSAEQAQVQLIQNLMDAVKAAAAELSSDASNVHWWNETFFLGSEYVREAGVAQTEAGKIEALGAKFIAYVSSGDATKDIQAGNKANFKRLKDGLWNLANSYLQDAKKLHANLVDQTVAGRLGSYLNAIATALGEFAGKVIAEALNAAGKGLTTGLDSFLSNLSLPGILALGGIAWALFSDSPAAKDLRKAVFLV